MNTASCLDAPPRPTLFPLTLPEIHLPMVAQGNPNLPQRPDRPPRSRWLRHVIASVIGVIILGIGWAHRPLSRSMESGSSLFPQHATQQTLYQWVGYRRTAPETEKP